MKKKVAIMKVGSKGFSDVDTYGMLIKYLEGLFSIENISCEVLNTPAEITDHTHIFFIADGMCEVASEIQKENPDKKVVLLTSGTAYGKPCFKAISSVSKGRGISRDEILAAVA